jgi:hypothetical protein
LRIRGVSRRMWSGRGDGMGAAMRNVVEQYLQAYNAMDVEGMLACMAQGVVFENFAGGTMTARATGKAELRAMALEAVKLFTHRCQTMTGYRESEGQAEVEIDFEGVWAVDLPGGIKAGDRISLIGRSVFRLEKGLIVYLADYS